jgi:bis(5'-nucleosyl)-tetraphosphatase (symmetrical)
MSTYVIGDVQGCFDPLQRLLEKIKFDSTKDYLWFTGDLVNRGPQSLETLRFIKSLGERAITVLGNHDIHLLAVAYVDAVKTKGDTIDQILKAPDREILLDWLASRPLLHHEKKMTLVHAGIAPVWSISQAQVLAREVESVLQSPERDYLLTHLYGNQPAAWSEDLQGLDRLRCIINFFTRMRFCTANGALNLSFKGEIQDAPSDLIPWFMMPDRQAKNDDILFGHWATLNGHVEVPHLYALDTGCVWGNQLTALCLEHGLRTSVHS